jgi:hypothetical protein
VRDLVASWRSWYAMGVMLYAARFAASLAIALWGVAMVLIGIFNAVFLWIVLGLVVTAVGVPFLASHPWAAARLYPPRGAIDPSPAGGNR